YFNGNSSFEKECPPTCGRALFLSDEPDQQAAGHGDGGAEQENFQNGVVKAAGARPPALDEGGFDGALQELLVTRGTYYRLRPDRRCLGWRDDSAAVHAGFGIERMRDEIGFVHGDASTNA